jgi:hypothetical protein
VAGIPQQLLVSDSYLGPVRISPDGVRLAYYAYDPEHGSLTSGSIEPPNTVKVLNLSGPGANTIRTVYQTETEFEFFAPTLEWQGSDRLLVMRSRFGSDSDRELDPFGLTHLALTFDDVSVDPVSATISYRFPGGQRVLDVAGCRDGGSSLLVAEGAADVIELLAWDGQGDPIPLYGLPDILDRVLICWSVTPGA